MSSHVNIRIRDEDELDSIQPNRENRYQSYRTNYGSYGSSTSDMEGGQDPLMDIELEKQRWRNRRRMAWLSLFTMIAVTIILLFSPISESRLKTLEEPITWFYLAMASIIGAYMGFTTYASIKGRN
jgi:hypothetical protein